MQKNTLIVGLGVILIITGTVAYVVTKPAPAKAPPAASATASSTPPAGSYSEHAAYYDITASYPGGTSLTSSANTAAIALMKKFITDTVAQFKSDGDFDHLTAPEITLMGLGPDRKEALQISYTSAQSPRTVSYIFTIYEDTLGAHGNTTFQTFTFDTTTGKSLSLVDLFSSGDYLKTLSTIARAKLPAIIGDGADMSMIQEGTTPDVANFQTFFLDGQDLDILFAPYAVAPYASGPQTLRIPVSELSSSLKAEYQ